MVAFPWVGPIPTLIDLTGPDLDEDDAKGSTPPHSLVLINVLLNVIWTRGLSPVFVADINV